MDTPLNAVVDAIAMAKYRTAFHLLWRLKRVSWSLSGNGDSTSISIYLYIYIVCVCLCVDFFMTFVPSLESYRQTMIFNHNRGSEFLPSLRVLFHRYLKRTLISSIIVLVSHHWALNSCFMYRCALYRKHMLHVINNFSEFVMFEVSVIVYLSFVDEWCS